MRSSPETPWTIGDWQVEPRRCLLIDGERQIRLEPQMMEVLLCLIQRPGEVISRHELIESAWHGRAVTDEALSVAVYGLRKALGDAARSPRYIETVPRRGYRWMAEVSGPSEVAHTPTASTANHEPTTSAPARSPVAPRTRPEVAGASRRRIGRRATLAAAISVPLLAILAWLWPADDSDPDIRAGRSAGAVGTEGRDRPVRLRAEGLGRPLSDEARRAFELGYLHIMRLAPEDVDKARQHFERCIELEPSYAPAWAGLSAAFLRSRSSVAGHEQRQRQARFSAEKALELDPELAAAHVAMARVQLIFDWHPRAAERHLRRALELDPVDAHTYQLNAAVQLALGQTEAAEASARKAVDLEPAVPVRYVELADILVLCDQPDAAMVELDRALDLDPRLVEAEHQRPFMHLLAGRHGQFVEAFRSTWDSLDLADDLRRRLEIAHDEDGVEGLLNAWVELFADRLPPIHRAELLVLAGEEEAALEVLESCIEQRCTELLWLDTHPVWKGLRTHPGWVEISAQTRRIRKS